MKKHILLLCLLTMGIAAQSQTLVLVDGDTIDFNNKEFSITADYNRIYFTTGDTVNTFDIRELATLRFAAYYTSDIENIAAEEAVILYDEPGERVVIHGGAEDATIAIYNSNGALVKKAKGKETGIKGLQPGVYIVSYNNKLNAKIMKK